MSIDQARIIIHPDHQQNFKVSNIVDYDLGNRKIQIYIVFNVYTVHPRNLLSTID